MGFYGNITNTNKTQFTFDRTYANRKTMEDRLGKDEIYLGRYVLIEYSADDGNTLDTYTKCYVKITDGKEEFYTSPNFESTTRVKWGKPDSDGKLPSGTHVTTNGLIYVEKDLTPDNGVSTLSQVFYKCTNPLNSTTGANATFTLVVASEDPYTKNYNIDTSMYGAGRGYDSTVWQKVYAQGEEKYVMIAELNSVVPTFDITADAPTMTPITPHFDADSTNVYYKLHAQPAWGFRVAEAKASYNSDQQVEWTKSVYDPSTDITTNTTSTVRGAINFNAPAFSSQVGVSQDYLKKKDYTPNEITVLPTGLSGNEYNTHDGTGNKTQQPDIQELRINLPAIGNMMSDAWDIIHGPNRDNARTDENGSLQGRLDSFKDMAADEIPIKRGSDGTLIGATINGGKTSLLDYTGKNDDAWIETKVNGNEEKITIHHTFTKVNDTTTTADKNTNDVKHTGDNAGIGDALELYTPIVDEMGHVVGKNVETVTLPYGFKTIKTNGRGDSVAENATSDPTITDVVADNTQDILNINSGNEWVRIDTNTNTVTISHDVHVFDTNSAGHTNLNTEENAQQEDNLTIYDWDYDEAGHIISKKEHTYTLPFGYKTITPGSASEAVAEIESNTTSLVADETQDTLTVAPGNKWVRVAGTDDTLTIAHEVHDIDDEPVENATALDGGAGTFTIQDITFDAAGHATSNKAHTYNLPFAIRNINVQSSSDIGAGENSSATVEADKYNDTLTLTTQNRWITLKANKDTDAISIGHAAAGGTTITTGGATESTNSETKTLKFGEKFTTPYVKYDEMGHITETGTREVTVPIGSLTDTNSTNAANVLTGIGFTANTGAITTTHQNVNTLLLTGHTDTTAGHVSATDSISGAFNKLDERIDDANTRIDDLDVTDTATGGDVVSTVQQTDGKITVAHTNVGALNLTGYTLPTAVSNLNLSASESLNTALGKLEFRINEEKNRIDDLDYSDESTTQVISKITQTDGKITVTRANAGTLLLTGYAKAENEAEVQATDSINTAFGKITKNLDVKTAALSKELADTIAGLDVDKIEAGEGKVLESVSEADGKISATSKSLGGIKITDYTVNSDTTNIANTDTLNAALGKLQAQINANESAIEELTKGETVDGINSVKELVEWTETHGTTTTGIINAIGKVAEGDSASTGLYALIDAETAARAQADIDTNKRIDDLVKVTEAEKTQWSTAEANVQSDWNETDNTKDSFILNKPTNLVTEETTFVYSEAQVDDEGNEIAPETRVTIQELLTMVKDLTVALQNANDRITELEKYHPADENGGTEVPPVDNGGEETPTDPETPST